MNIATFKAKLRKGRTGTFRALKPGESIEAHDVEIYDTFYDYIAPQNVGQPCGDKEVILRLEFPAKEVRSKNPAARMAKARSSANSIS